MADVLSPEELKARVIETDQTLEQLRAQRAELEAAIWGLEQRRVQVMDAAVRADAKASGLRRSTMTPAAKSAFIRQYTKVVYDTLPW
jgi:hypothetical protein